MADTAIIGIRFLLYVTLMVLFGLPLFGIYALRGAERVSGAVLPFRPMVTVLAVVAIGLAILSIVAMTAAMAGVPIGDIDRASVQSMITETSMGRAWQVRVVALVGTFVAALLLGRARWAWWLMLVAASSGAALGSLAWTGHGAAGEGTQGNVQLIADVVHLLAAGGWVGALTALIWLVMPRREATTSERLYLVHRVLRGFSLVGSFIVGLIVISGLINSWVLVGPANAAKALETDYGQLLLVKLVLFAAMLGLAAVNRYRLTLAFAAAVMEGDTGSALGHLRRSLAIEIALAITILALVAWLGTLQPPMAM